MGKVTGFLEFERNDRDYAPVEERVRHYREFLIPLPEPETRKQAAREFLKGRCSSSMCMFCCCSTLIPRPIIAAR